MGLSQPTGRTIGRTRILTLAPGPVGSYPIEGCTPRIHPSTSHWSLGCSPKPHLDFSNFPGTGSFAKVLATTAPTSPFSACFTLETAPDLDFSNSRKSLYTGMTAKQPPKRPRGASPSPWQTEHPTVLKRGQKTGRNACAPGPISRRGLGFRTPGFHHPRPTTLSDVAGTLARTASCTVQFLGTSAFAKVLATTPQTCTLIACFTLEKAHDLYSYNSRKSLYTGMTAKQPPKRPRWASPSPWQIDQPAARRSFSEAMEQAGTLVPLARCPVEAWGSVPPDFTLAVRLLAPMQHQSSLPFSELTGTSLFAKVLAGTASLPPFPTRFRLPTTRYFPFRNSRKSLYTGMTVDPTHFRPLPQKGGPASPPICGMVSRFTAPHTRRQSDRH